MLTALEKAKQNGAKILAVNPLQRGRAGPLQQPADARAASSAGHRARRPAPAGPDQRRPRAVPGDRVAAAASGTASTTTSSSGTPIGFEEWAEHVARRRLGRRRARHRPEPGQIEEAARDVPRLRGDRHLLGDGHHPAPQRGGHGQGDRQRRAAAGQHRQARRRAVPGARPLQRAGRPHDGHLGASAAALPRRAADGVRLRPAARARPRHRRRRSARCATATPRCSSGSAATSSRRHRTPTSPRRRCATPT